MLYQLSYRPSKQLTPRPSGLESNGQGQNRTADTVIFSHVLYQLSYLARQKNRPDRSGRGRESCQEAGLTGFPLPPAPAGSTYRPPSKIADGKRSDSRGQSPTAS